MLKGLYFLQVLGLYGADILRIPRVLTYNPQVPAHGVSLHCK